MDYLLRMAYLLSRAMKVFTWMLCRVSSLQARMRRWDCQGIGMALWWVLGHSPPLAYFPLLAWVSIVVKERIGSDQMHMP
jgi:hypothetical protein